MVAMVDRSEVSDVHLGERIRHALAYPFARPACSYLFSCGVMRPLSLEALEARIPVLASGSNSSPARLRSKFGEASDPIPVTRATLRDFAVVFAGHFTGYGAVPATLYPCSGATTQVWITWLTPGQLSIMHRSEGVIDCREAEQRYDYVVLQDLGLEGEIGGRPGEVGAYLARRMLAMGGRPLRFAEVMSKGCALKALNQRGALRLAHQFLDPGMSFRCFMAKVLSHAEARQVLFRRLAPFTIERP